MYPSNVEVAYGRFKHRFMVYYDKNLMYSTRKNKNKCKKPWLSEELLNVIKKRKTSYIKYIVRILLLIINLSIIKLATR